MGVSSHGLFRGLEISSSGMTAERTRLNVIASNIANAEVTAPPGSDPYRRKVVSFAPILEDMIRNAQPWERAATGVRITKIHEDMSDFQKIYKPGHPHADEKGYVTSSNVNMTFEMVDMITALRAYEANLSASRAFKEMANKAIQMGR